MSCLQARDLTLTIGSSAPVLLAVVRFPPPGSEMLLLQMLHVLTDDRAPTEQLVDAVWELYDANGDIRFVAAVLAGMSKVPQESRDNNRTELFSLQIFRRCLVVPEIGKP